MKFVSAVLSIKRIKKLSSWRKLPDSFFCVLQERRVNKKIKAAFKSQTLTLRSAAVWSGQIWTIQLSFTLLMSDHINSVPLLCSLLWTFPHRSALQRRSVCQHVLREGRNKMCSSEISSTGHFTVTLSSAQKAPLTHHLQITSRASGASVPACADKV